MDNDETISGPVVISIADCEDQLAEAKVVDDLAFRDHQGITMDELRSIMHHGFVALLSLSGQLVAESQVVMERVDHLNWELPRKAAFCYGIAVHPQFQGRGLGKLLLREHENIAARRGALDMFTTIRVENAPSIKLFVKAGHKVIDYIPFYGEEKEGHRLLLGRSLAYEEQQCTYRESALAPVIFGDKVDPAAHEAINRLIVAGFVGTSITDRGIHFCR